MLGEKFTIDIKNNKGYPKIIEKVNETEEGYMFFILETEEGSSYKAIVERMTSNGKYVAKMVEKLN